MNNRLIPPIFDAIPDHAEMNRVAKVTPQEKERDDEDDEDNEDDEDDENDEEKNEKKNEEEDEEEHEDATCPICMEEGGTVTLCPRIEQPCAARYHEECAELYRKQSTNVQCPTCRANIAVALAPAPATALPEPVPLFNLHMNDAAGFLLCYVMALALLLIIYLTSGILISVLIRLVYGDPDGIDLQRHRVYLNGSTYFDVRVEDIEDIEDIEGAWEKTTRRLRIDPTTYVTAIDPQSKGTYQMHGDAQLFYGSSDGVNFIRIDVGQAPLRVREVRHIIETPTYETDIFSAAFFDQAAWGILWGVILYGWKRLLHRATEDRRA